MNNRVLITVAVVILILVAIGILVFRGKGNSSSSSTSPSTTSTEPSTSPTPSPSPAQSSATISYTKNGFTPSTTTIKSGGTVTFKNDSSEQLQVNSNPHPTHTANPELNVGAIAPGSSKTVTLTTTGTWGFHNHLDPSDTATVIVQ